MPLSLFFRYRTVFSCWRVLSHSFTWVLLTACPWASTEPPDFSIHSCTMVQWTENNLRSETLSPSVLACLRKTQIIFLFYYFFRSSNSQVQGCFCCEHHADFVSSLICWKGFSVLTLSLTPLNLTPELTCKSLTVSGFHMKNNHKIKTHWCFL